PSASSCVRREIQIRAGGSTSAGISRAAKTMRSKSAINAEKVTQSATCPRAASGNDENPSCSSTCSTSLHCMAHHSARVQPAGLSHLTKLLLRERVWFLERIFRQLLWHIPG